MRNDEIRANVAAASDDALEQALQPEADVTELTPAEWRAAVLRGLDRVGVTRDELIRQGRTGHFQSVEAKKLWLIARDELLNGVTRPNAKPTGGVV